MAMSRQGFSSHKYLLHTKTDTHPHTHCLHVYLCTHTRERGGLHSPNCAVSGSDAAAPPKNEDNHNTRGDSECPATEDNCGHTFHITCTHPLHLLLCTPRLLSMYTHSPCFEDLKVICAQLIRSDSRNVKRDGGLGNQTIYCSLNHFKEVVEHGSAKVRQNQHTNNGVAGSEDLLL